MKRRAILQKWMEENERGVTWISRKTGYARVYVSNVVHGHRPFSDKFARALTEQLGIQFEEETKSRNRRKQRTGVAPQ